jgi:succinate dehydrogenase/fumarate reductase-like Fe-S protein
MRVGTQRSFDQLANDEVVWVCARLLMCEEVCSSILHGGTEIVHGVQDIFAVFARSAC